MSSVQILADSSPLKRLVLNVHAAVVMYCKLGCPLVIRYMRELALTLIRHDGMRPLTSQSGNRPLFTLTISMTWALQDPDLPVCV